MSTLASAHSLLCLGKCAGVHIHMKMDTERRHMCMHTFDEDLLCAGMTLQDSMHTETHTCIKLLVYMRVYRHLYLRLWLEHLELVPMRV